MRRREALGVNPSTRPSPQPSSTPPAPTAETPTDGREHAQATAAAPSPPWDNNDVTTSNYERDNAAALLASYRRAAGVKPARLEIGRHLLDLSGVIPAPILEELEAGETAVSPDLQSDHTAVTSSPQAPEWAGEGVKHYPTLGMAFLPKRGQGGYNSSCYQVWLLMCQHEQQAGAHGMLPVSDVRALLADRLGWSAGQIRKIIGQGNGRFWTRDDNGRLFRHGVHRLANEFNAGELEGRAVILPNEALEADRGTFNAHLFAAFFSGQKSGQGWITQEFIQKRWGLDPRTQRRYLSRLNVKRTRNTRVVACGGEEKLAELATEGYDINNLFWIRDSEGREGKRGGGVWMKNDPSTTYGIHRQTTARRKRKINKRIDPVATPRPGNGSPVRIFHANAKEAAKAHAKNPHVDHVYPAYTTKKGTVVNRTFKAIQNRRYSRPSKKELLQESVGVRGLPFAV
jgi:hypothetical protein